jgi:hypothetical protein
VLAGVREDLPDVIEFAPKGTTCRFVPAQQFAGRISVKSGKPLHGRRADDVHSFMFA